MYNISVSTYKNKRLKLIYKNNTDSCDITCNLSNIYIDKDKIFLNPVLSNEVLRKLRKLKIIKDIYGIVDYNNMNILVASVNLGILKRYDYNGINKYREEN